MIRVVGVVGLARPVDGELRRHRLAHDDGAGFYQQADDPAVLQRLAAGIKNSAVFRRQAVGIEDVLDTDWNAVQRPHRATRLTLGIEHPGLIEGIVWLQVRPGLDFTIGLLDPVKTGLDQFLGSDLTVAYFLNSLGGGKFN